MGSFGERERVAPACRAREPTKLRAVPPSSRYSRVFVRAWECVSAAGDAAASWRACADGDTALRQVDGIGWCGSVGAAPGAIGIDGLIERAASGPWAAIAGDSGALAMGIGC